MSNSDIFIGTPDLHDILDRLTFTEQTLPVAVLEQSKLFMEAVRFRTRKMRQRQSAELEMKQTRAKMSLHLRRALVSTGKVTEGMLNERLDGSDKLALLQRKIDEADQLEQWAWGLQEALKQRRDMLKVYAQLVSTDPDMRIKESDVGSLRRKADKLRAQYPKAEDV